LEAWIALSLLRGGPGAILVTLAYLPALWRALRGWTTLSNKLPPLKRVGIAETCYALWFTSFLLAALLT
jgi:hypothetical protein